MIGGLRRFVRFLESARLATWLLVIVGVWSVVASFVPQGRPSEPAVAMWAAAHPTLERVVQATGLHQAFSTIPFIACVLVLAVSTILCAWRRTKVALGKMGALRRAAATDAASLADTHDVAVRCSAGLERSDALSIASRTLARLSVKTARRDDLLSAVSPGWSVWGSPLFHWGLVAMILVILIGSLQRSEGVMGVPVGQRKPDTPASYGVLRTGPLHS